MSLVVDTLEVGFGLDLASLRNDLATSERLIGLSVARMGDLGAGVRLLSDDAGIRRSTASLSDFTREVRESATALSQAARLVNTRDATAVAGMRESLAAERDYLESIRATSSQYQRLDSIAGAFNARVLRDTERVTAATRDLARANEAAGAASRAEVAPVSPFARSSASAGFSTGRLASGAVGAAFAADAIISSLDTTDSKVRTLERSLGVAALAFGPEGALVSAALAGGDAIYNVMTRTDRAVRDLARNTAAEVFRLRESLDVGGLSAIAQRQFSGGFQLDDKNNVVYRQGLQQLEAQATAARKAMQDQQDILTEQNYRAQFNPSAYSQDAVDKAKGKITEYQLAIDKLTPSLRAAESAHRQTMAALTAVTGTVVERTGIAIALRAEEDAARELTRVRERSAREAEQQAQREVAAVNRVFEQASAARLSFRQDVAGGIGGGRDLSKLAGSLSDVLNTTAPTLFLQAKLATTRAELEQDIKAQLSLDDNPFVIQIQAELARSLTSMNTGARAGALGGANPFLEPDFAPGGRFSDIAKYTHTAADDFSSVATDAGRVAQAFQQLPALADSIGARLVASVSQGAGGITSILGGRDSIQSGGGALALFGGISSITTGVLALGGAVGALSSVFAKDDAIRRENNQILRANTLALEQARLNNAGYDPRAASSVLGFQSALAGPGYVKLLEDLQHNTGTGDREILERQFSHFGVTISEVEEQARSWGITLYNSKGQIDFSSVGLLADRARIAADELTHFGKGLSEFQLQQDITRRVFDRDNDPTSTLRDEQALLVKFAPNLADRFAGIDPSTKAGQTAFEAASRALLTDFTNGKISLTDLGDLQREGLLDFLTTTDNSLDELGRSARDAARSLNLVSGYRIEQARFFASAPVDLGGSSAASSAGPLSSGSGSSSATTGPVYVFNFDGATIQTAAKDGKEFYDSMAREAERRSRNLPVSTRAAVSGLGRTARRGTSKAL